MLYVLLKLFSSFVLVYKATIINIVDVSCVTSEDGGYPLHASSPQRLRRIGLGASFDHPSLNLLFIPANLFFTVQQNNCSDIKCKRKLSTVKANK